jgi:hypothetical protein
MYWPSEAISMRQNQFPLLGLLLALFVGARVGTPGNPLGGGATPSAGLPSHSSVGRLPIQPARQLSVATSSFSVVQSGCHETTSSSKDASQMSAECLPPLPPLYQVLCRLNPQYSSNDDLRSRTELAAMRSDESTLPKCLVGSDHPLRIDSVLAAVADPEHTHLGLLTDRTIEAIQAATAEALFNPYSHFLPWTSSEGQKSRDDNSTSKTESASHQPGLLIFRKDDPKGAEYLAVFLIAESPTTGLDQESFFAAHRIIDAIVEQTRPSAQETSHVLQFAGPSFSGSVGSLGDIDQQLERVAKTEKVYRTHCIHAFSGMVTAEKYSKQKGACKSELILAQTPDSEALDLFVKGMQEFYGYQSKQIAVLSEEGTAYGNAACRQPGPEANDAEHSCNATEVLSLQFPREISKLRNAYAAVETQTSATAQTGQEADVQMNWKDSEAARGDDIPTYSAQTPLSQEAVLSNLAVVLKGRQIKLLGILATDPMDEAFLIRSFKKSSPDVRIFLRDPDLLYLLTPDVGSLNGTLLVNNYPLLLRNQSWSRNDANGDEGSEADHEKRVVTFSSAEQEGQYDAFLLVLQATGMEFSDGSKSPPLLEWRWPTGKSRPSEAAVRETGPHPLWLTTIGTTGQFPLALLNVRGAPVDERHLDPQTLDVGNARYTGLVLWAFFTLLALAHVWGLSLPNALPRLFLDDFDLGDATDTITASKAVSHVAILMILGLIQFVLGSSYVYFRHLNTLYACLAWVVFLSTSSLAVSAIVVFLSRVAWPYWARSEADFRNDDILDIRRPLINGTITVAIFAVVGMFWVQGVFEDKFRSAFLHYRDLILAGGVAPCLPIVLLLLVAYLGVWVYLRRLSYWGYRRPPMPTLPLDDVFPSDFKNQIDAIDRCVVVFLGSRGWTLGFCLFLILAVPAFRLPTTMEMIEAWQVRWMAHTLFAVAFLALTLNWFRFINIWSLLRYILQGLERLPIRHAFERMPSEKSMPIWGWGMSNNSFLPTTEAVDTLRALVRQDAGVVDTLSVADLKSKISILGNFELGKFEERRRGIWGLLVLLLTKQQPTLVELSRVVGGSRTLIFEAGRSRLTSKSVPNGLAKLLFAAWGAMLEVVNQLIRFLSSDYWRRGSDSPKEEDLAKPEIRAFVLAEDLVAMRYYTYVRYVVTELRNLLFFVAMAFSLLFMAFHSYAFRADQTIDWSFIGLFLVLGAGVTVVLYQMEIDPILSHFGGTQAGEVSWSFYFNLLKYGAVPFLTIIGSQVPAVSNLLLRWVQPTLQSLR